ncbi:MFS transporter [Kibdelosporangium phytohabitans]|uniref:MFS transporter n=1 Tax=Kibdelosporangium phytohabitans TaxID=860235 RepID=A0A0N9IBL0_9PSEU|nr:MFS transporter [Kibdelosporangium phytohabitans]ALG11888.1 MFS transporter [Kibdelosporangium phytohabitans]MBE1463333.1 MFS family permease [Kibdelosporangium phytohabitans]
MSFWGLLRHRDFRHLWAADALSQTGSRVSVLAVPLLAVSELHASAFEVSLLRAAETAAYLVLGLQTGAWCARRRSRPVLVATDLLRAAALLSIPIAAAFGVLTFAQVIAAVAVSGVLTVAFEVSATSYLPAMIGRDRVVDGNSLLQLNRSVGAVAGPGLAGYLVQWFTAPAALLVDSLTYLWSALWLGTIRRREPRPEQKPRATTRADIAAGIRFVWQHPLLRATAIYGASRSLTQAMHMAVAVVFLIRDVGVSPGTVGVLGTVGLTGALLAAVVTRRLADIVGSARLLWLIAVLTGLAFLLYPLTGPGWGLVWYVVATFVASFGVIVASVLGVSFEQQVCPDDLLPRVNATVQVAAWGAIPLGSLLGGALAELAGTRVTLWVAAGGVLLSAVFLLLSPLTRVRDLPRQLSRPGEGAGRQRKSAT